ncbi:MAG: biopolymer transporter ExbD [Metallibacterium scheffleri]|jgi:biopolymer transport protein ExbD|uniref:ExbD/TolR family protein n=1 Tax=Metallibacterium scheffleri TaxID=993689 RepID=UPI0026F318D2|nr:biopolymer transporter ExbD [Metallibacterium scheffleri]MBU6403375.1 biopolymer transporter ExbD [Pseudomonadota bacterium]MCK9367366.1 biopolymer transporter ExbD [Metallibacterium scheffleri]
MRITAARRHDDFEINVISLIDVLLTLLMFFVLTTTFVQQTHMKVSLPTSSATPSAPSADALVIVIDRAGRYAIGNTPVQGDGERALQQAIVEAVGSDRTRSVILRADAESPNQSVVTAMDALGRLGFTHLALATTPRQGAH